MISVLIRRTQSCFAILAAFAFIDTASAANLFDWIEKKFSGKDKLTQLTPTELRDPGPIVLKPGQPVRFWIGDAAPEAELPRGRSHFRRVEVEGTVERAHVRIATIADVAPSGKGHAVFKPLIYVLAESGDVRETFEPDPLVIDIRPFKRTRLNGCVEIGKLQRFLVATSAQSLASAFQSAVRESLKAPTQGGFYYRTEALKVKLPYKSTGELIMTVVSAGDDSGPCGGDKSKNDSAGKNDSAETRFSDKQSVHP